MSKEERPIYVFNGAPLTREQANQWKVWMNSKPGNFEECLRFVIQHALVECAKEGKPERQADMERGRIDAWTQWLALEEDLDSQLSQPG